MTSASAVCSATARKPPERGTRPLLIGQAPGPNTDPGVPLSGASGRRLAALCGLGLDEFLALFDRANLLPEFPGKLGKGEKPHTTIQIEDLENIA